MHSLAYDTSVISIPHLMLTTSSFPRMKVLDMVRTQQYLLALMEPAVAQDKGALVLYDSFDHPYEHHLTYLTKM
ncbi:MAG: hypothetical protein ACJ72T_10890 [Nitrososphaeraceae archaeon]